VLEIGTGLGWQAAVMTALGARVRSVEIVEEFAEGARLRLASQGHDVDIRVGDGSRGWPEHSPFDRILVTAAAPGPARRAGRAAGARRTDGDPARAARRSAAQRRRRRGAGGTLETREVLPVRFTQLETAI
jgi:protein-L-isoaspartate(D-aspartate) O-methyltransferase